MSIQQRGMETIKLDCRGLRCPMPIVKLGMAVRQLEDGTEVEVEATDPAFEPDLHAWARKTGHTVVHFDHGGDVQRALVRTRRA